MCVNGWWRHQPGSRGWLGSNKKRAMYTRCWGKILSNRELFVITTIYRLIGFWGSLLYSYLRLLLWRCCLWLWSQGCVVSFPLARGYVYSNRILSLNDNHLQYWRVGLISPGVHIKQAFWHDEKLLACCESSFPRLPLTPTSLQLRVTGYTAHLSIANQDCSSFLTVIVDACLV